MAERGSGAGLRRGLGNRHIQFIALGGAIGTGLFYGSSESIGQAGPAVVVCYLVGGAVIFLIMRALGEMSVHRPRPGSFSAYAYEYWSPRAGFVAGWNYWFDYTVVSMAELSVVGEYVQFWAPQVPAWVSSAVFLVVVTAVNLVTVKAYGEVEFWLALVKIVAIGGMIVGGLLLICTGIGGPPIGVANLWAHGGFAPHGLRGVLLGLVVVMFSFGGVELIGVTAGEAGDPARTIPRAINGIVGRILIFYVGTIAVMVTLHPWDRLGSAGSPLVTIFSSLGIAGAAHILNVVVLTAAVSAFNSFLYANGRMLYSLAQQGNAPDALASTNRHGSPWLGVLVSAACTGTTVLLDYLFPGRAFVYIMAVATISVVITWVLILVTHLKFRARLAADGQRSDFPMPGHPVTTWIALAFLAGVVALMALSPSYRIALVVGPIWVALLLVAHELRHRVGSGRPPRIDG